MITSTVQRKVSLTQGAYMLLKNNCLPIVDHNQQYGNQYEYDSVTKVSCFCDPNQENILEKGSSECNDARTFSHMAMEDLKVDESNPSFLGTITKKVREL